MVSWEVEARSNEESNAAWITAQRIRLQEIADAGRNVVAAAVFDASFMPERADMIGQALSEVLESCGIPHSDEWVKREIDLGIQNCSPGAVRLGWYFEKDQ